ncbi:MULTISPECIES: DUF2922 domain-containing protein [Caloramator]|uniref:DUF2922 domain-containing protein n=1 Tax=Caloramator australicus RC3 TaxID=857293 RepID=G0V4J6_9CLOT|nr:MULTISPECIES: DUF2922 domain-containing protein [Caloramator]MDO6355832.1 DUF2922 domain-containing protein [Caloramator sp. CAR-1]CCC58036.1 hypothetical protein CAAU_0387 [Caloramator australicus RC3]
MKTLQMVFQNTAGRNVSINIPYVKDGITTEEIRNLMQLILAKNIFDSTGGNLVSIMGASVISRDVTDYAVR